MNFDKYQYKPKGQEAIPGEMKEAAPVSGGSESWRDSASVLRLSEYMKENRDHGISLIVVDGKPSLHFDPPLTKKTDQNAARWKVAENCYFLLFDSDYGALPDLLRLIELGKIKFPGTLAGPPAVLEA